MTRASINALVLLTMVAATSRALAAQATGATPLNGSPSDPYAAYANPGECAAAALRMELQYRDTHSPDTTAPAPLYYPARRETVVAAGKCVVRFSIATARARELLGLGQAYLAAEQVLQADSAFRRWLVLMASRPPKERRWALVQIVKAYLDARPARLTEALAYVARLEALGPVAAPERLKAHLNILRLVVHMDSVSLEETEVHAIFRATSQLPSDTASRYAPFLMAAYAALAELHGRQGDGPGARRAVEQGTVELQHRCHASIDMPRELWPLELWAPRYRMLGLPAPSVQATQWFPDSTNGRRPVLGRRSLLLFTGFGECNDGACDATYAALRRLRASYPDLDVTVVTRTVGSYRTQLVAPGEEIEWNRRFFLDEQRLPGVLAVWQTTYERRSIDRGLQAQPNPNMEAYSDLLEGYSDVLGAVLVDRKGVIRMYDRLTPDTEIRWRHVIGELP